jgi:hypothetical protein
MADDDLTRLVAVRARLEAAIGESAPRDLAGLSREYRQVLEQIRELHTPEEMDRVDQLAARRAKASGSAASNP